MESSIQALQNENLNIVRENNQLTQQITFVEEKNRLLEEQIQLKD